MDDAICDFCRLGPEVEKYCGKLHCEKLGDQSKPIAAHHKCMQYSAKLVQYKFSNFGGFEIDEVQKELRRGISLKCYICKNDKKRRGKWSRATSGCAVKKCHKTFHYYCARVNPTAVTKRMIVRYKGEGKEFVLYRVFCGPEHEAEFKRNKGDLLPETKQKPESDEEQNNDEEQNSDDDNADEDEEEEEEQEGEGMEKENSDVKSADEETSQELSINDNQNVHAVGKTGDLSLNDNEDTLLCVSVVNGSHDNSQCINDSPHSESNKPRHCSEQEVSGTRSSVRSQSQRTGVQDKSAGSKSSPRFSLSKILLNDTKKSSVGCVSNDGDKNREPSRKTASPKSSTEKKTEETPTLASGTISKPITDQPAYQVTSVIITDKMTLDFSIKREIIKVLKYQQCIFWLDGRQDLSEEHIPYLMNDISELIREEKFEQLKELLTNACDLQSHLAIHSYAVQLHQSLDVDVSSMMRKNMFKKISGYIDAFNKNRAEDLCSLLTVGEVKALVIRLDNTTDPSCELRKHFGSPVKKDEILEWTSDTFELLKQDQPVQADAAREALILCHWLNIDREISVILKPEEEVLQNKNDTAMNILASSMKNTRNDSSISKQKVIVCFKTMDSNIVDYQNYVHKVISQLLPKYCSTTKKIVCALDLEQLSKKNCLADIIPKDLSDYCRETTLYSVNPLNSPVTCVIAEILLQKPPAVSPSIANVKVSLKRMDTAKQQQNATSASSNSPKVLKKELDSGTPRKRPQRSMTSSPKPSRSNKRQKFE